MYKQSIVALLEVDELVGPPPEALGSVEGFPADVPAFAEEEPLIATDVITESQLLGLTKEQKKLVEDNMGLANACASYCISRFEAHDPEAVTGSVLMGLVRAAGRFDTERGVEFSTFAWKKMTGEVLHYFREMRWPMHVERSFQEDILKVRNSAKRIAERIGRLPSYEEIANDTKLDLERVQECTLAYMSLNSINVMDASEEHTITRIECNYDAPPNGVSDFDVAEDRVMLGGILNVLPERERRIVILHFYGDLSQREIAEIVGISQMHVSRRLHWALAELRRAALGENETAQSA